MHGYTNVQDAHSMQWRASSVRLYIILTFHSINKFPVISTMCLPITVLQMQIQNCMSCAMVLQNIVLSCLYKSGSFLLIHQSRDACGNARLYVTCYHRNASRIRQGMAPFLSLLMFSKKERLKNIRLGIGRGRFSAPGHRDSNPASSRGSVDTLFVNVTPNLDINWGFGAPTHQ